MKTIEYISDWAIPYYLDAVHDLASSGVPDVHTNLIPEAENSKWFQKWGPTTTWEAHERIGALYGVNKEKVTCTSGASGGLFFTALMMSQYLKPVVIETPVYEPIWRGYEALGIDIKWLQRNREDKYSVKSLLEKAHELTRDASCLTITNPHNPTGVYDSHDTIKKLAEAVAPAYLVVNEAYLPLNYGAESVFGLADNIVIMTTMTKSYGVGAIRMAWVMYPESLKQDAANTSILIQGGYSATISAIIIHFLEHRDEYLRKVTAHFEGRHDMVDKAISEHPRLNWIRPPGKVIISAITVDGVTDHFKFSKEILKEHKVILGPGKFFGDNSFIRMGIGATPEKFDKGFELLLDFAERYEE